jgi:hypothetical protein
MRRLKVSSIAQTDGVAEQAGSHRGTAPVQSPSAIIDDPNMERGTFKIEARRIECRKTEL